MPLNGTTTHSAVQTLMCALFSLSLSIYLPLTLTASVQHWVNAISCTCAFLHKNSIIYAKHSRLSLFIKLHASIDFISCSVAFGVRKLSEFVCHFQNSEFSPLQLWIGECTNKRTEKIGFKIAIRWKFALFSISPIKLVYRKAFFSLIFRLPDAPKWNRNQKLLWYYFVEV